MNRFVTVLICILFVSVPIHTVGAVTLGDAVPNCSLILHDDKKPYNIKQHQGKVLYIDFWTSWCGPCAKSFPFMSKLHSDLEQKGLQIVGVNLDEYPKNILEFLAKFPANFPVAEDHSQQCAKAFDVKAMPSSYLVDRKGIIRHIHIGFRSGEAEELRTIVEQLLAETPSIIN